MSAKKFDITLIEKPNEDGLKKTDLQFLLLGLKEKEFYFLEIENPCGNSVAMGLISKNASEHLDYDHTELTAFVQNILKDVRNETEDHTYQFKNLSIFLTR